MFTDQPCIKHPLSGEELKEAIVFKGMEIDSFISLTEKAFTRIRELGRNDDIIIYLYLWRNLLPLVNKYADIKHKPAISLWQFAPADTRMPDHSIFEHLKISAACGGAAYGPENLIFNSCSLLLFSIGPVQNFISQARKTEDLYWGSFLISYLTWRAIEHIAENFGPDAVIFPDINGQPWADLWLERKYNMEVENSKSEMISIPAIPNRFMAIIPIKQEDKLRSLGDELARIVKNNFISISECIVDEIRLKENTLFKRQVEEHIDIYWFALPWPNDEEGEKAWQKIAREYEKYFDPSVFKEKKSILEFADENGEYRLNIGSVYGMLHSLVEVGLASRKNCRDFSQLDESGRKCTLCGERNIVIYRKSETEENLNKELLINKKIYHGDIKIIDWNDEKEVSKKYLQPGEGLCGVCISKRMAGIFFTREYGNEYFRKSIPSTADVALAIVHKYLSEEEEYKKLKSHYGADFEGRLIFESEEKDDREDIKKLKEKAEKKGIEITPYYGIIMMDGDEMGKWLSNDKAPTYDVVYHPKIWASLPPDFKKQIQGKKRPMTPAIHLAISQALMNFALEYVGQIVEERHHGIVIYSGGDDLLAMVPRDELLATMLELRAAFSGQLDEEYRVDLSAQVSGFAPKGGRVLLTMGPTSSASAGVCIGHYKMPLKTMLDIARKMEKKAKNQGGRDAFAIAAMRHSGHGNEVCYKWRYDNQDGRGTLGCLERLVEKLKRQKGEKTPNFSDKFIYNLHNEFSRLMNHVVRDDLIRTEIYRMMLRQCQIEDREKKIIASNELADMLYHQVYLNTNELQNFFSFLDTAAFLSRGGEK